MYNINTKPNSLVCEHSVISLLSASVLISTASLLSVSIFTSSELPALLHYNKYLSTS